ncbi:hypothetical protein L9F63_007294, partial [Diploptera punctata]
RVGILNIRFGSGGIKPNGLHSDTETIINKNNKFPNYVGFSWLRLIVLCWELMRRFS